jgi:hypothetical protein
METDKAILIVGVEGKKNDCRDESEVRQHPRNGFGQGADLALGASFGL